jgi:hypothetical protein
MVGTQCQKYGAWYLSPFVQEPFQRMQDARWIIYRAIGINRRRETIVPEPLSHLASEARPHQQYLLAGPNLESCLARFYFCSKLHRCKGSAKRAKCKINMVLFCI